MTSALTTPSASALSPEIQSQLEALRDINLPDPISWWPLAVGWWGAAGIICTVLVSLALYLAWRRHNISFVALRELEALRATASQANLTDMATEVSVLLRRVAMRINGQHKGTLNGADWIAYLTHGPKGMDSEVAGFLAQAPYAADVDDMAPKAPRLLDDAELWIRRHA